MMMWFKKQVLLEEQHELEERIKTEIPENVKKQDEVIEEANEVAENLTRIVEENGFTLKIFQATGGKLKGVHK